MARIGASIDRVQRRHPVLGVPVAVIYKFLEDQGFHLAAIIAFYGMLSLFPLLLILSTVVGFVLQDSPEAQRQIITVAVQQVPMLSESFVRRQFTGSGASLVIGVVAALWGALGVGTAVQNAMNTVWNVPRLMRPNPFLLRLRSLGLLLILLLFVLLTTAFTQLGTIDVAWTPYWVDSGIGAVLSFVIATFVFALITHVAVRRPLTFAESLPGALMGALLWQLLQSIGAAYVTRYVATSTIADGVIASLLGVLVWVFLAGISLVFALEFNVVVVDKLYPRSLASLFVDNTDLTEADMVAYSRRAQATQFKTYQRIDVDFEKRFEVAAQRRAMRSQPATEHPRDEAEPAPEPSGVPDDRTGTAAVETPPANRCAATPAARVQSRAVASPTAKQQ